MAATRIIAFILPQSRAQFTKRNSCFQQVLQYNLYSLLTHLVFFGQEGGTLSNTNEFQFNPAQLSTWENARETARKLSEGPIVIGGGVLPETGDPRTSGLYVPDWFGGPAQFREPSRVDAEGNKHLFIHFRFRNGAEGMNAGLVADRFRRYPTSPLYALRSLAEEAAMLAGEQTD